MTQFIPAYIISYSNSDFTNPHEVVLPDDPKDCTADYTHMGVKYWGLETKRHQATTIDKENKRLFFQHDACNWVRIGFKKRSEINSLAISTKWFTGNQARAISVFLIDELTKTEQQVLNRVTLLPDQDHNFPFDPVTATECLIKIYYEGGICRINFFGTPTSEQLPERQNILTQATISHVSNIHYGHPGMAVNGNREELYMKGWESARTGFGEQAIFHLKQAVQIEEIVVDTYLHRLNAPLSCHVFGLLVNTDQAFKAALEQLPHWTLKFEDGMTLAPKDFQQYMLEETYLKAPVANPLHFEILLHTPLESPWKSILPFEPLQPDTFHRFLNLENKGPFSHLLYMHYPNGGIHGLKVYGS